MQSHPRAQLRRALSPLLRPGPRASFLALAALCGFDAHPSQAADAVEHPDVLLITIDTLRADHLGSYGFSLQSSPEIDAFARESALFERAIAASAVTAPSHASILTSKYVREHSIGWANGATRLSGATTLAEIFRSQGYDTAAFVGNVLLQRRMGMDPGFDVYDDELPSSEQNRALSFERIAERSVERAVKWIEGKHSRPLFAWVHLQDPHGPYIAPPGYRDRFRLPSGKGERPLKILSNDWAMDGIPAYQKLEGLDLPSQYRSRYADEIFYADHWVGELLRHFEQASERQSVVLITADHGESMGEDYRFFSHGHSSTPQVARVPFLVRAPGIPPQRRRELVSHVDVFPTLVELAGLQPSIGLQGIPLGPFLRDAKPIPDRIVYCDIGTEVSAYTGDRFLRVRGTEGAWAGGARAAEAPVLSWSMYRWDGADHWERAPFEAKLQAPVWRYIAQAVPMLDAPPLDIIEYRALEALGYLRDGQLPAPPERDPAAGKSAPAR